MKTHDTTEREREGEGERQREKGEVYTSKNKVPCATSWCCLKERMF